MKVLDQFGNLVTDDNSNVTLALGANPGGGTLSGTLTAAASGGIATFNNLSVNKAAAGYSLSASDGGLSGASPAASPSFQPRAITWPSPSNRAATAVGHAISPAVTVQELDPFNNLVTTDNTSIVALTFAANPGSSTLLGTSSMMVSGGVATFTNLSLNHIGTGYKLAAKDGTLSGTSAAFNIVPASTTTTLTVAPSPSVFGQAVTITAAVIPQGTSAVVPAGTVTFQIDGASQKNPPTLDNTGKATFTTSGLSVGGHTYRAIYTPTADFTSTGPSNTINQAVDQAATMVVVTASPTNLLVGTAVTATATVSAVKPGAGIPFGTITFIIDKGKRVPITVPATAQVTYVMPGLGVGQHTISAIYNGNRNFIASAPAPIQTVTIVGTQATSLTASYIGPANLTTGTQFSISVTALNALGNRATNYNAAVKIQQVSVPANLVGTLSLQFNAGIATFKLSATAPEPTRWRLSQGTW